MRTSGHGFGRIFQGYDESGRQITFIHNGYVNDEGLGILIALENGQLVKASSLNDFYWRGRVSVASEGQAQKIMEAIMQHKGPIKIH